jgi:guanine nucleotide-binding protein G(i) subunit alpha
VSSASYFFDNILRLTAPDFLPTESDILHSRKGFYSSITKLCFDFPKFNVNFLDIRLGGERRKWIHQVDDIPVVLSVVDLCTYDHVPSGSNTLEDLIMLFGQIVDRDAEGSDVCGFIERCQWV